MGVLKFLPSCVFLVVVFLCSLQKVSAGMTCEVAFGMTFSCPTFINDSDDAFCCYDKNNVPSCCNLGQYIVNNTAIIAGVIAAAVVLLLLITLCCCCCCSCCLLAKRRQSRGQVLYGPVSPSQPAASAYPPYPPSSYPLQPGYTSVTHQFPQGVHIPPPYSPGQQQQPPFNPGYPQNQ